MQNWHTNLVALSIIVSLLAKWWEEKKIDLSDWTNTIGVLAAIGFIVSKDASNHKS